MSELLPPPSDIFDLPYSELAPITRTIKSTSPEVRQAPEILSRCHPSLEQILMLELDQYQRVTPGLYSPDSFRDYFDGFTMAYATYHQVATSRNLTPPQERGELIPEEWILETNRLLMSGEWLQRDVTRNAEITTSIPVFRERMAGWHEAGARAAGRKLGMPYTQLMDFNQSLRDLLGSGSERIDTRPIERGLHFLDGYGRVLLALQTLDTAEHLPQL